MVKYFQDITNKLSLIIFLKYLIIIIDLKMGLCIYDDR